MPHALDLQTRREHLFLVDGSGYIFRAFHALPPLTRADGTPVGAVLGFVNMLLKLYQQSDGSHLVVVFDAGRRTYRNDIYPDYKANRSETPEALIPQFPLIREACQAFGVATVELEGYEADDLIATYATQMVDRGGLVTIVSSDKDLMQLVGDRVDMLDPMKNRTLGAAEVVEKFGVSPNRVVDVQALAGDASDNVPGVPGIGIKTAAELINAYGDLESLLGQAHGIKQPKRRESLLAHADLARISKELVSLKADAPAPWPLESFQKGPLTMDALVPFLKIQGFHSVINRLELKTTTAVVQPIAQEVTYETVTTPGQLQDWVAKIQRVGVVAVDTETTALRPMGADLVGISLSVTPLEACYIPVGHRAPAADLFDGGKPLDQLPLAEVMETLKPLLEDPAILKVGQNIKYDLLMFRKYGVHVAPIDDTMVLSYVLDGAAHGHGMDELSQLHLNHKPISFGDVAGTGKAQKTFDLVPLDQATAYAAEDADVTLRLYQILKPRLVQERKTTIYETLERPLVPVLAQMEWNGVVIDPLFLRELGRDLSGRLMDLEQKIYALAGKEFNVASPKQMGEVLFDHLKLPGGKVGKTGAYGTNVDVLEELAQGGHAIAEVILSWRQLAKLKSTYTDTLVDQINPKTRRVHTSYTQTFTVTGRLSSQDPNLQNIPTRTEEGRKIRQAFVAPPGTQLCSFDYSQIELRLLAHMAHMESLKTAFLQGQDVHALTASQVFGVPLETMDGETRRRAKAINFGIIYGISAFGLARQLGISQREAAAYMEAYFAQYPGIKTFMEAQKAFARTHGYVETILKRQVPIVDINNRNAPRRNFAERQAINAPLQGSSADIIKRAMIDLYRDIPQDKARMILQVHDELVFEIAEGDLDTLIPEIRKRMESAATLSVPLVVDVGIGHNWGALQDYS